MPTKGSVEFIDVEKRYLRKDGSLLWGTSVRCSSRPVKAFLGFSQWSSFDITKRKRKRAEEELQQKEISLREALNELAHVSRVTTMGNWQRRLPTKSTSR